MGYRTLGRRTAIEMVGENYESDSFYRVVGKGCLKNNIKIKGIILSEVRIIEEEAFCNCTALKNVEFPKVESVREQAFANCSNLKAVVFPKNLKEVDQAAFYKCKRMENVSFSEGSLCRTIRPQVFAE